MINYDKNMKESSNSNLDGFFEAEVRDNIDNDLEGKIKVYIPKMMYDKTYNEKPSQLEYSPQSSTIANKSSISPSSNLNEINYMTVRPANLFEDGSPNWKVQESTRNTGVHKIPRVGSRVIVFFLDGDPQKGYYLPFTPTITGDRINTENASPNWSNPEKNPNIQSLTLVNGTRLEIDFNEDANLVKITIPAKDKDKYHTVVYQGSNDNDTLTMTHSAGTYIKLHNKGVDILGDVFINGNVHITKDTVINGENTVSGIAFTPHTHSYHHGNTSPPH